LIGALLFIPAVTWVVVVLATNPSTIASRDVALLLALTLVISGSRMWPVRVGKATRVYVASVPLYLLTCLFSPPVASAAIGMGMLGRETSIYRQCDNQLGTVATQIGRWMILSFAVSSIVHAFPAAYLAYAAALGAGLMYAGDLITCPFLLGPVTGRRPWELIRAVARQSYAGELMQYLIAMLTLLLFRTGILWTGILWVDILATLMVVLPIVLLYLYLKAEDAARRSESPVPVTDRTAG
jgi:hypothetical protein